MLRSIHVGTYQLYFRIAWFIKKFMEMESDFLFYKILHNALLNLKQLETTKWIEMSMINLLKFQLRLKKPVLVDGILCLNI